MCLLVFFVTLSPLPPSLTQRHTILQINSPFLCYTHVGKDKRIEKCFSRLLSVAVTKCSDPNQHGEERGCLVHCMALGTDQTGAAREWRKHRDRHTNSKVGNQVVWALCWKKTPTEPETLNVYLLEMSGEAGLVSTAEQEAGLLHADKEAGFMLHG